MQDNIKVIRIQINRKEDKDTMVTLNPLLSDRCMVMADQCRVPTFALTAPRFSRHTIESIINARRGAYSMVYARFVKILHLFVRHWFYMNYVDPYL